MTSGSDAERLVRVEERQEADSDRLDRVEGRQDSDAQRVAGLADLHDADAARLIRVEERQEQMFGVLQNMEGELRTVSKFVTTHLAYEAVVRQTFVGAVKVIGVVGVLVGIYIALYGG